MAPYPQAALPAWLEIDETWLPIGGVQRSVAMVLELKSERLDLSPGGLVEAGTDWFTRLEHTYGSGWDKMAALLQPRESRWTIMARTRGLTLRVEDWPILERRARSQILPHH